MVPRASAGHGWYLTIDTYQAQWEENRRPYRQKWLPPQGQPAGHHLGFPRRTGRRLDQRQLRPHSDPHRLNASHSHDVRHHPGGTTFRRSAGMFCQRL